MKIVLAALNAKYVHSNLAVYDIEAYARVQFNKEFEGCKTPDIKICEYTINHNLDQILQSLYKEKATMIAFSCYIWNIQEILTIAKELHKVAPSLKIWLGGPEVSYDSEKLLEMHSYIDGIMQGEGEATFYDLVKCFWKSDEKGTRLSEIEGIVYRNELGKIISNPHRKLLALDEIPFIYSDLTRFENKILYYETSRGCPFSCSYCLSSIDKRVRFRSFSLVEKELQFFLDHKVPQVKFIDRTFNCKREHSLEIWEYLVEHDNGVTNFHFEVAADLIGEPELKIFEKMRPGLIQLEIGLQSTNPETIKEIRRVMDVGRLKETLLTIRGFQNIHQHLDLIAGLPYEDFETFKISFNQAYEMKPNQLQLGFLKVLKGSYMGEQIDVYELNYQDHQPYEVLSTKWLSYDNILALKQIEEMVEVYYNSDQFEHVLPYLVSMYRTPYDFYEALAVFYEAHDLYGIGFKRENRYKALREFCLENSGRFLENEVERVEKCETSNLERKSTWSFEVFESLLIFDYYLRENAKTRPSWNKEEPIERNLYHNFFKNGGIAEYSLQKDGYDSKLASRIMHIEPVTGNALSWILMENEFDLVGEGEQPINTYYCLYDYECRNSLTGDAKVVILPHL